MLRIREYGYLFNAYDMIYDKIYIVYTHDMIYDIFLFSTYDIFCTADFNIQIHTIIYSG